MAAYTPYDREILAKLTRYSLPSLITIPARTSAINKERRYSPYRISRHNLTSLDSGNQLRPDTDISSVGNCRCTNGGCPWVPHDVERVVKNMQELKISGAPPAPRRRAAINVTATTKGQHGEKAFGVRRQRLATPARHQHLPPRFRTSTPSLTSDDEDSDWSTSRGSSPCYEDREYSPPRISMANQFDIEQDMHLLSLENVSIPAFPLKHNQFNPYSHSAAYPGDGYLFAESDAEDY